jgi:hypothetical protein
LIQSKNYKYGTRESKERNINETIMITNDFIKIIALTLLATGTATARRGKCGTKGTREPKDPILPQSALLQRRQDDINLGNSRQQSIKVSVQTHVIRGGGKNVDAFTKQSTDIWQKTLNDAFASFRVSFDFRDTKFYDNATLSSNFIINRDPLNLIDRKSPELLQIVVAEKIDRPESSTGSVLFGVSSIPWDARSVSEIDFVRMAAFAMPPYDPATLLHEVGHWFGLLHTFEHECPEVTEENLSKTHHGDYVRDTPIGLSDLNEFKEQQCKDISIPDSSKCTLVGKKTPEPYPVDNFMSYTPPRCQTHFTAGQGARMHAMWAWRKDGQGPPENTLY